MTSSWQPSRFALPGSRLRLFLRPDQRWVVPSKTSGMPRPARVSAHLTGLLHVSIALLLAFSLSPAMAAEDAALYAAGEKLFKGNCASCHKPDKDMTGPALQGA